MNPFLKNNISKGFLICGIVPVDMSVIILVHTCQQMHSKRLSFNRQLQQVHPRQLQIPRLLNLSTTSTSTPASASDPKTTEFIASDPKTTEFIGNFIKYTHVSLRSQDY